MTKARTKREKHGLKALMARVTANGITAIDGRSAASRALMLWKSELVRDLGGDTALSAQQLTIIELACRARLYLDSVDGWLMRQKTLVNRRHKSLLPVLRERMQLADALARHLAALGLERRDPPAPSVADFWKNRNAAQDDADEEPTRPAPPESQEPGIGSDEAHDGDDQSPNLGNDPPAEEEHQ
jgi:hypothetical protein